MNFNDLPSGLTIELALSDRDAEAYAVSYLNSHNAEIKDLIKQRLKISLDVSEPEIRFKENALDVSCRAGMKFVRATASAAADVNWDGKNVQVNVTSLNVPVISLDPSMANSLIQRPIANFVSQLQEAFDIRSFRVEPGRIFVSAVKK